MHIPILLYHRISPAEPRTSLCVAPERFREHMEYLSRNGYTVVPLADVVACKKGLIELPFKSVAITFDDGYEDNYLNAYPALKDYGFPATIFIVSELVGKTNIWDTKGAWPEARLMDWDQISRMSSDGIDFGSHGLTHRRLSKPKFIPALKSEFVISKNIIEKRLRKRVNFFSYPFGANNRLVRTIAKMSGYSGACVLGRAPIARAKFDPYALSRIEINTQNSGISEFASIIEAAAKPPLNILHVCTNNSWGGQELYAVNLASRLKMRGHRVHFALRKGSPIQKNVLQAGLLNLKVRIHGSLDPIAVINLARYLRAKKIDLVHVHVARDYFTSIIAAKIAGTKVVLTRHLLTPLSPITMKLMRYADRIIAVSRAVKLTLTAGLHIPDEKIVVIYHGVDTRVFCPGDEGNEKKRAHFGFAKDDFVIGNVGHMGCKGQPEILLALEPVCKKYPKVRCLFISEASTVPDLEARAARLGIRENILFRDYRDDIPDCMRMFDLFVITPKLEAFGIVLIEAMACARAVIGSAVGGIPEIIKERFNGLLVPYRNIPALSEAITYMIEHAKERVDMGLNGYATVKERFEMDVHVDAVEKLCRTQVVS